MKIIDITSAVLLTLGTGAFIAASNDNILSHVLSHGNSTQSNLSNQLGQSSQSNQTKIFLADRSSGELLLLDDVLGDEEVGMILVVSAAEQVQEVVAEIVVDDNVGSVVIDDVPPLEIATSISTATAQRTQRTSTTAMTTTTPPTIAPIARSSSQEKTAPTAAPAAQTRSSSTETTSSSETSSTKTTSSETPASTETTSQQTTQQTQPAAQAQGECVSINTANEQTLVTLRGIGPVTAASIIAYREEHGAFRRLEDIQNVRGIGPGRFAQIRDFICL